jgi:hypothetical protein
MACSLMGRSLALATLSKVQDQLMRALERPD